jgi:3-hydroxyacyl-[acyl-carrier-protein] dehydratase
MLKEPLFKILSTDHQQNVVTAVLDIDQDSEIFEGHFPNQPVVPGACMLQLIKEILVRAINTPLRLAKADNIKFLTLVEPGNNQVLVLELTHNVSETEIKVNGNLTVGDTNCMKFQGTFKSES